MLIKNAQIITLGRYIPQGYVLIDRGVITRVGDNCSSLPDDSDVIDARGRIVMPGLINCHTHCSMTLLRGFAGGLPLEEWLFDNVFPMENRMTGDDIYWGAMLGIMEMLASGVTAFADMYSFMDRVADAVNTSGIRANLSRGLMCTDKNPPDNDVRLQENIELFRQYNAGRIKVDFGPHAVYTCSPAYLEKCAQTAGELGAGIHMHISETRTEQENCIKQYGLTPAALANSAGLFEGRAMAAHCVHLSDDDMDIMAEKRVAAIHSPSSNLKLGSGIARVSDMLERKMLVALGTDGASSNNNLNMLEELHLAALLTNGATEDSTAIPAQRALDMATRSGAQALGYSDLGEIREGFRADLIMVNNDRPHMIPQHSALDNILYSAQAADVELVMTDGQILYENGEYKTIDYEQVKFEIEGCIKRLRD